MLIRAVFIDSRSDADVGRYTRASHRMNCLLMSAKRSATSADTQLVSLFDASAYMARFDSLTDLGPLAINACVTGCARSHLLLFHLPFKVCAISTTHVRRKPRLV
jgi:hypothetical protein